MTRKTTVVVMGLGMLTLVGFILVSRLFGTKQIETGIQNPAHAQPTPTIKLQAAVSPSPTTNRGNLTEGQFRSELVEAQSLLDQLNSTVLSGDWANTLYQFNLFDQKTQRMPAPQLNHPDISPVMQDFFAYYKVHLARSINEQNFLQARFAINQLYGIISEQRARFGTRGVPLEFQRLHFLIREIEIWSQSNDVEMLRVRISSFREAWKEVRPVIVARRNGAEQVKHFDELVEKLTAAGHSQELATLIPELNKEFDRMNNLFQRPARSSNQTSGQSKIADDD